MDKKLLGLMVLFFLLFSVFAVMVVFEQPLTQFTRAKEETLPSLGQTRILAWPLYKVKADGKSVSTITVIVRNTKTKPLDSRLVTLTTTIGELQEASVVSNKQGMAIFHLTSTTPGIALVEATVDNAVAVKQGVSIQFVE